MFRFERTTKVAICGRSTLINENTHQPRRTKYPISSSKATEPSKQPQEIKQSKQAKQSKQSKAAIGRPQAKYVFLRRKAMRWRIFFRQDYLKVFNVFE